MRTWEEILIFCHEFTDFDMWCKGCWPFIIMLQHKKKKDLKIEIQFRANKNYVMNTHDDKKYAPIESICHSKIIICNRKKYIHFQSVYSPEDFNMATEIIKNIENFVFLA